MRPIASWRIKLLVLASFFLMGCQGSKTGLGVGHAADVLDVQFSPDGRMLISASLDGTVRVWSVPDLKPLVVLKADGSFLYSAAFTADQTKIAAGGYSGKLYVWDWPQQSLRRTVTGTDAYTVIRVKATKRTNLVLYGGGDLTVRLFDTATGIELTHFKKEYKSPSEPYTGEVQDILALGDGKTVIWGDGDAVVWTWDTQTGRGEVAVETPLTKIFSLSRPSIWRIGLSDDAQRLLLSFDNGHGRLYDWTTKKELLVIPAGESRNQTFLFVPRSHDILAVGKEGMSVWSEAGVQRTIESDLPRGKDIRHATLSPDGKYVAASFDNTVLIVDLPSGIR